MTAPLDWMADGLDALAPVAGWIDRIADRHEVALLHLNLPSQARGLTGGRPVVAACHSCLATWFSVMRNLPLPPDLGWHRTVTAEGCAAAGTVISPSGSHARLMARVYGTTGVRVVHNASHAPEREWSEGEGILAVGRWWDEGKNAAVLDEAAGLRALDVTMIGDRIGPDFRSVPLHHARAAGSMPHDEALGRVGRAAVFVSPSRYEPFGLAALEAARASRPLVLADIPTYRELWDDAAVFFPPDDPDTLSRTLSDLVHAPNWRRKLGEAARERAARYTPAEHRKAMTAVWQAARDSAAPAPAPPADATPPREVRA
ncbi:glycosyltransferase family 4 protein [Wenxinia marina]|uniref:Glycosyltransferase n=1 Tax=Wenxinia marina DSM 24838 TaxID=1123501 RepID=A0A0D0QAZ0_9RHOB|nr:glycosyltransferase [Wenxinia marina]KIQ68098.1 Glycosyltransferase [Wenxinia marina DSM 24838]